MFFETQLLDVKIPPFMGAIAFKDYNEEFLSEAQNSVSLYSLNQKVDDGSVTLQSSSSNVNSKTESRSEHGTLC